MTFAVKINQQKRKNLIFKLISLLKMNLPQKFPHCILQKDQEGGRNRPEDAVAVGALALCGGSLQDGQPGGQENHDGQSGDGG